MSSSQTATTSVDVARAGVPEVTRYRLSTATTASTSASISLQEPLATHRRHDDISSSEDGEQREATELDDASEFRRVVIQRHPRQGFFGTVQRFWRSSVRLSVPHVDCRDHLGRFFL
jgi:hypothetical protein